MNERKPLAEIAAAASAGLIVLIGLIGSRYFPASILAQIDTGLRGIHDLGVVGILLFVAIQIVVSLSGFVPGSLIGIASGAVYGVVGGFTLAAFSTMTGALLAFLLSRRLFRPLFIRLLTNRVRLHDFESAIGRDGWRFVCLLRLSPIMPFAATSYALGASSVTTRAYMIGTLASLPALFCYVIIGSLTKTGFVAATHGTGVVQLIMIGFGVVATVFLTWRLGRLAAAAGLTSRSPYGGINNGG